MSTARTGTLMVRHYVDNRRPFLGVFVDDDPDSMSPQQFELALEIAASHAVSAHVDRRPLALWVGVEAIVTSESPATRDVALDRLCLSMQTPATKPIADHYEHLRRIDPDISAFVIVTGPRTAEQLLPPVTQARRRGGVVVMRCIDETDDAVRVPRRHDGELRDPRRGDRWLGRCNAMRRLLRYFGLGELLVTLMGVVAASSLTGVFEGWQFLPVGMGVAVAAVT